MQRNAGIAIAFAGIVALAGGCDLLEGDDDPEATASENTEPSGGEDEQGAPGSRRGRDSERSKEQAWTVDRVPSLDRAMLRWRRLWRKDTGDGVKLARDGEEWLLVASERVVAEEAAAAVESEVEPTEPPADLLEPTIVRTTVSLNVRHGPDTSEDLVRTLPNGTVVVGAYGTVNGETSEAGGRGHWTYVTAAHTTSGWSASTFLEDYDGCLPLPARMIAEVPSERRARIRRDVTYSAVDVRKQGRTSDGFMLVARDSKEDRSYVGVYRTNDSCDLAKAKPARIDGYVEDAFLAQTDDSTGKSLLVVGWHPQSELPDDGELTWAAYELGESQPFHKWALDTGLNIPRRERDKIEGNVRVKARGQVGHVPVKITRAEGREELFFYEDGQLIKTRK